MILRSRFLYVAFGLLAGGSGCAHKRQTSAAASSPQTAQASAATPAAPAAPIVQYSPMIPFPYDRSIPAPTESVPYEGRAPQTEAEWRAAVAADPTSNMAHAERTYRRADGQMMWHYTKVTPLAQQIGLQGVDVTKQPNGKFSGHVTLSNLTGLPIMDVQVVLQTNRGNIVLVAPTSTMQTQLSPNQSKMYTFTGSVDPNVGPVTGATLRVEVQVNGPPGLITGQIGLDVSQSSVLSGR